MVCANSRVICLSTSGAINACSVEQEQGTSSSVPNGLQCYEPSRSARSVWLYSRKLRYGRRETFVPFKLTHYLTVRCCDQRGGVQSILDDIDACSINLPIISARFSSRSLVMTRVPGAFASRLAQDRENAEVARNRSDADTLDDGLGNQEALEQASFGHAPGAATAWIATEAGAQDRVWLACMTHSRHTCEKALTEIARKATRLASCYARVGDAGAPGSVKPCRSVSGLSASEICPANA